MECKLISVEERLPNMEEAKQGLFGFHVTQNGKLKGTFVFYSPNNGWGKIGEINKKAKKPDDPLVTVVNIDDEVDYWAVIPDEFWNGR